MVSSLPLVKPCLKKLRVVLDILHFVAVVGDGLGS